jgi:hypothetical protein
MYTELTRMRIPCGEITDVYKNIHVIVVEVILRFEITKIFYLENVML